MGQTKDAFPAMRNVFEILRDQGNTADGKGAPIPDWQVLAEIRGAVEWQAGGEQTEVDAQQGQRSGKVTIRYYSGLTSKDRLRFKGTTRVLHIQDVQPPAEVPHLMEVFVVERTST